MAYFDFRNIGMEPRDKRVYEALYRQSKGSLRSIAEATGLNRGTVHEIVKRLTDAGLAQYTEVGLRKYYTAASPETLLALLRERRSKLKDLENAAVNYAAELESRQELPGVASFVSFYEGIEGFGSILRDVLSTVRELEYKEYYVISCSLVAPFVYKDFKNFFRVRSKEGIRVKVIADAPRTIKEHLLCERRVLPKSIRLSSYTIIYGPKIAILHINDQTPTAMLLNNQSIVNTNRLLFEQLWQSLPGE